MNNEDLLHVVRGDQGGNRITSSSSIQEVFFDSETQGTCANGAALEAIFGFPFTNALILEHWDEITAVMRDYYKPSLCHYVPLPCDCDTLIDGPQEMQDEKDGTVHRLDNIIVHLNNHHRWTREQIADWLESEEEKLGFVTVVEETEIAVRCDK